jgi:hypothetical protein
MKILKGCLFTFLAFVAIVIGIFIYSYYKPNKVVFRDTPRTYESINQELNFDRKSIPEIITRHPKEQILYQAVYSNFYMFAGDVVYKQICTVDKPIMLKKRLPFSKADAKLLDGFYLSELKKPVFKIPKDHIIKNGHLAIYKKIDSVSFSYNKGSYSITDYSIDGEGHFSELIVYDANQKLLYIGRFRYFAMQ